MITGFENKHNMFFLDRPMAVQTVSRGTVLPRKETENGPMWGLGGVCDENGAFAALSAYDVRLEQTEDLPDYPYRFYMWQYTQKGTVDGVAGEVPLNICFIDYTIK